jgi:zinc transporter 13
MDSVINFFEFTPRESIMSGSLSCGAQGDIEFCDTASNPEFHKWILSAIGCILIGLTGIFPFFIFRPKTVQKNGESVYKSDSISGLEPKRLNCLLSFAVGSLLGDAFLHLLPEAWERSRMEGQIGGHPASLSLMGLWILIGIISFVICEKLVTLDEEDPTDPTEFNGSNNNGDKKSGTTAKDRQVTGYLNLLANIFDNFTHGLAVGGSFIISTKVGVLTTLAILLHEIPHEIADFGILLRSGFNPLSAAKAQLWTATVGLLGAVFALTANSVQAQIGNYTWWILPYTAGCFITISMTNLLPDIMKERDSRESLKQMFFLLMGIAVMGTVTCFHV